MQASTVGGTGGPTTQTINNAQAAIKVKAYKKKLKRHKDAVLTIHSPKGFEGGLLVSGSADHSIRIWDLLKKKISSKINVVRPDEEFLFKFKDQNQVIPNYAEDHILNNPKALQKQATQKSVCCFCFNGPKIFTGYEDGLICSWDIDSGQLNNPLIGHTNRINHITSTDNDFIFSSANDCTVRQWNIKTGGCDAVFKFADPVSVVQVSYQFNMMFTASWDKMVRIVDLEANKVTKSFVASKEAIKAMIVTEKYIFVAGCDPIIRGFSLETGECKMYQGHQGWIYCLEVYEGKLFSGGDDKTIKIWDIESTKQLEELNGHENGVTCLAFANQELFSGSFDHYIICWDMQEIEARINERELMRSEDILSRKIEIFWRIIESKKGKKKKKGGKGKKKK